MGNWLLIYMTKRSKKVKRNIILATCSAIFSLGVTFTGAIAWFLSSTSMGYSASKFEVTSVGGAQIKNVQLIKFEYGLDAFTGDYDYLDPTKGSVKRYQFNEEEGYFGETIEGVFHKVDVMNVYDPVTKVIQGDSFRLFDMNCNAIYELTFEAEEAKLYSLDVFSNRLTSKTKQEDEIFLTDCVDFDVFYQEDVEATIGTDGDGKPLYYPTYINKETVLTDEEELYYRLSYWSSEAATHSHFYVNSGDKPTKITMDDDVAVDLRGETDPITFKVYVNANYAHALMDKYLKVLYSNSIRAVYDFNFEFIYS